MAAEKNVYKILLAKKLLDSDPQKKELIKELLSSPDFKVKDLFKDLKKADLAQKRIIESILIQIEKKEHLKPLVQYLKGAEAGVKSFALKILSKIKIAPDVQDLITFLRNPNIPIRSYARKVLIEQGDRDSFDLLQKQIAIGKWPSYKEAITVLVHLGGESSAPALAKLMPVVPRYTLKQIIDYLAGFKTGLAMKALESVLTNEDPAIRLKALQALKTSKSPRIVELLSNLLDDSDDEVRKETVMFLSGFKDKRLVPAFIKCLNDRDYNIKITAVKTLGRLGARASFEPLLLASTAGDDRLEQAVQEALSKLSHLDDVAVVETIIKIVRTGDENGRKKAIFFLSGQQKESVVKSFMDYLMESEWWVRERVITCLNDIHSTAFDKVIMNYLEADKDEMRGFILDIIAKLKKYKAVDLLLKNMDKSDQFTQERVITVLGQIGDKKVVPYISRRLDNEESRWTAAEALGNLGLPESFDALTNIWDDCTRDEKITIAESLRKIDESRAIEYLKQFIFNEDAALRGRVKEIIDAALAGQLQGDSVESLACLLLLPDKPEGTCEKLVQIIKEKPFDLIGSVLNMLKKENPDVCGEFIAKLIKVITPGQVKGLISLIASMDLADSNQILDHMLADKIETIKDVVLDLLSSGNETEKHIAAEIARRIRVSEAVPLLVKILPESSLSLRQTIFEAMKNIDDDPVIEQMIACLEIPEFRWQAAEVLGALKAAKATQALIEAGDDSRTEVVAAVLEAMVSIGGTQIKNKLRELTHHQDRAISLRALRALQVLSQTKDADRDTFVLLVNMAWNDESKGSDEVVARLKSQSTQEMEFLDIVVMKTYSGDGLDVQKALNLLCRLGDKEIITGFLSRFSKADNKEKQKIITAFDQTRNEQVIEVMISIIEGRGIKIKGDELDLLRSFIITIAQKVELKEAVPALISILNKENWVSRNYIIQTLGIIGDKRSIKPVLAYLDDPDSRWTVIDALGQIKDKTVVTRLIETMDKVSSSDVIIAALRAIGRIGDPSVI